MFWYKNFEEYLQSKHLEDYRGDPDYACDDFHYWLADKEVEDIMKLADEYIAEWKKHNEQI